MIDTVIKILMGIGVFISLLSFFSNKFVSIVRSSNIGLSPHVRQDEYNKLRLGILGTIIATVLVPYSFWALIVSLILLFIVNVIATVVAKIAERN